MKVIHFDWKAGELKAVAENSEDLWHLERVMEIGDEVESKSFRRFKTSEGEAGEKKPVTIRLRAEKIEFSEHANKLRVTGPIKSGNPEEFVQIGSYHTIDVELNFPVKIIKHWKQWQVDRLKQAQKETKRPKLEIIVLDEEKAVFARLKAKGVDFAFEIKNNAGGKGDEKKEEKTKSYFGEIMKKISEGSTGRIVIAGPGFTKDNLRKFIAERQPELVKKIIFESCSNAEESGVYELLKRGVLAKAVQDERVAREFELIEKLMAEIGRESGLAVYGVDEVRKASEYKAIGELLVLDEALRKHGQVEKLLEENEANKAKIIIFSSENDAGKQLAGLGGIAGILRFKMR
ncbi:mRNA surveillance protein pelota [Candidatus Micrarchaeota archaeon]|nr:mRNA surveillance protein pelota [Candidatus Micrarchaeota archaeon]